MIRQRNMVEYAMMFQNYEGVMGVKRSREIEESLDNESTDIFTQQVENLFGRSLSKEEMKKTRNRVQDKVIDDSLKNEKEEEEIEEEDTIIVKKTD